jgi:hypothetical protein
VIITDLDQARALAATLIARDDTRIVDKWGPAGLSGSPEKLLLRTAAAYKVDAGVPAERRAGGRGPIRRVQPRRWPAGPGSPWCAARDRGVRACKGAPKSFTENHLAALLDAAHQQLGAPIVLVCDGLPQHKSAKMRRLIAARRWLRVYPLPALAPELNPTETVWSSLKRSMANLAPGSIKDLARITHNRIKSMQYQPDLITGFLASTGLRPP